MSGIRPVIATGTRALLFGAAVLVAAPAAAATEPGASAAHLLRAIFGLLAVVGILLIGARLLGARHGWQGSAAGRFRVAASIPLGHRERAVLLQLGDKQLLVGVAPGRVSLLHELDVPLEQREQGAQAAQSSRGSSWLERFAVGRNG